MAEKTDHDSSAHSNPDHYITQIVNDPSELKLVSLQNETSRQSKTAMRAKNQFCLSTVWFCIWHLFYDRAENDKCIASTE